MITAAEQTAVLAQLQESPSAAPPPRELPHHRHINESLCIAVAVSHSLMAQGCLIQRIAIDAQGVSISLHRAPPQTIAATAFEVRRQENGQTVTYLRSHYQAGVRVEWRAGA